jgi:hypothetical protein
MIRCNQIGRLGTSLVLTLTCLTAPLALAEEQSFQLPAAVPDDVFLCISQKPNPERAFLDAHWAEVMEAFDDSGIVDDLLGMLPILMGEEEQAEVGRLMDLTIEVVEAVDWAALGGQEFLFAERMPMKFDPQSGLMPEMVWLFHGKGEGVAQNFESLTAIIDTIAGEVNQLTGEEVLAVETVERENAKVASLMIAGNPIPNKLDIAMSGDVILIGWGTTIFDQTLTRLTGDETAGSIAGDGRYVAARKSLPNAEDTLTFFDMKALLESARSMASQAIEMGNGSEGAEEWQGMANTILDTVLDVPGMIDHVVTVEYTEGLATYTECRATLSVDAASKPFYEVIGNRPALTGFDRFLPVETVSFSVNAGINPGALYSFVQDTVHGVGPEGEALIEEWENIQDQIGLDVATDILGWIDGRTVTATLGRGMSAQWVLLAKVTDEELAQKQILTGLQALAAMAEDLAEQNPMMRMMVPKSSPLEDERLPGFQKVMVGGQPLVWGVADGHLILGAGADSVALCLETAAGNHPNVRENEELMSRMAKFEGNVSAISFEDKRNLGKDTSALLGMAAMSGMMLPMMIPDPTMQKIAGKALGIVGKLSPVAAELDFYISTSSCTTFDGKSWLTRDVTYYLPYETEGTR